MAIVPSSRSSSIASGASVIVGCAVLSLVATYAGWRGVRR